MAVVVNDFYLPRGISLDPTGGLIVADYGSNRIRKLLPSGEVVTIAGTGTQGFTDGSRLTSQFAGPSGVAVDRTGTHIYVADGDNHRIRMIHMVTGDVTTVAGSGRAAYVDGARHEASFNYPRGVALDHATGHLYVSDWGNNRIRVIDATTGTVSTLAGSGVASHTDGNGITAGFDSPTGIAIDHAGSCLYISDSNSHRIRRVTLGSGDVITVAGFGLGKLENGSGDIACFNQPTGICVDPMDGSVYVADFLNAAIRRISFHISTSGMTRYIDLFRSIPNLPLSRDLLTILASFMEEPDVTTVVSAKDGLDAPNGVAVDQAAGCLYVVDTFKHRIRTLVLPSFKPTIAPPSPRLGAIDLPPGVLPSDSYEPIPFKPMMMLPPLVPTSSLTSSGTTPLTLSSRASSVTTTPQLSLLTSSSSGPNTPPNRPMASPAVAIDRTSPRLQPLATPLLHTGRGSIVIPLGGVGGHHAPPVHPTNQGTPNAAAGGADGFNFDLNNSNPGSAIGTPIPAPAAVADDAYTDVDGRRVRPRAGMPMLPSAALTAIVGAADGTGSGRATPDQPAVMDDDHYHAAAHRSSLPRKGSFDHKSSPSSSSGSGGSGSIEEGKLRHYLSLAVRQSDAATREADDLRTQLSMAQTDKIAIDRVNRDLLAQLEALRTAASSSATGYLRLSRPATLGMNAPCIQACGEVATIWCSDCGDALCGTCDTLVHHRASKRRVTHQRTVLHAVPRTCNNECTNVARVECGDCKESFCASCNDMIHKGGRASHTRRSLFTSSIGASSSSSSSHRGSPSTSAATTVVAPSSLSSLQEAMLHS